MLMHCSPSCHVAVALSLPCVFMKQELSRGWMPGAENCDKCSICQEYYLKGCGGPCLQESKIEDDLCSINSTRNYSQLSASSTMSQNFTPTFVYQRRRRNRNSAGICSVQPSAAKPSDGCHSAIYSEIPSMVSHEYTVSFYERASEAMRSPITDLVERVTGATGGLDGFSAGTEAGPEEALLTDVDRSLNVCCHDNCSSSKSNLELNSASLKIDADDAGECSSSGALISEKVFDEMSERDICISILRSQGLLAAVQTRQDRAPAKDIGILINNYSSKSCRVCEHPESTSNLLICDNCEDAFHVPCCNPPIARIPVGEWLCNSCLKKKHKLLKEKSASTSVIGTEFGSNGNFASEGEFGSLEFMFRDTEPYMSNVRIGDDFQANVPDWSGPIDDDYNLIGDPLELDSSATIGTQGLNSTELLKLSSIGNWLQCQEVIEGLGGDNETICGKWRRAPLFEVQTDEWECFCCILWDPAHADCAVPQELDTDEVIKQLKYIEMLRPQLAAKRCKLESSKSISSQGLSRFL